MNEESIKAKEEDIELWYEEQKQALSEQYIKSIEDGLDLAKRESRFDSAMHRLERRYNTRLTKVLKQKENLRKRKRILAALKSPFAATGAGLAWLFRSIGASIKNAFNTKCAQLHFRASIAWTRNAYKFTDGTTSFFRPFFYFYVKYLQMPCITLAKPFIALGRAIKKIFRNVSGFMANLVFSAWNSLKATVKSISKKANAAHTAFSTRLSEMSRKHREWYDKKLQEQIDRRQARKEAKERKRKEREARKAGKSASKPAQAKESAAPEAAER